MTGSPQRIGRYVVVRELGRGGMGEVYLAYSPAGDPVAVKLIRVDSLNEMTRKRFEKEALIARTVVGTNRVARFLDADPFADRPWLAMEYVPGKVLQAHVKEDGPLQPVLVASLGALLAEGISAVHSTGLLHRDLKPQNIILGDYGPVVIDFGLAAFIDRSIESLSRKGMIVGTPACMSPEQANGDPQVTAAADVYSLGTVLLFAATGHGAYTGGTWQAIVAQVANREQSPDLSGLPDVLRMLVTSMLAYEPTERVPGSPGSSG
jgi:serine/threonine protein kinase